MSYREIVGYYQGSDAIISIIWAIPLSASNEMVASRRAAGAFPFSGSSKGESGKMARFQHGGDNLDFD